MAAWSSSRVFANLMGHTQIFCRRTVFSCFSEITATPGRQLVQLARSNAAIFNQARAASNGGTSLRDYFSAELRYQREVLDCKSISDLPTFKDFELKIDEYGDASFTRTHKGQTVTVWLDADIDDVDVDWRSEEITSSDDSSEGSDGEEQSAGLALDDLNELGDDEVDKLDDNEYFEEASPQIFHVSVTSNDKAAKEVTFICEFTVDTVYDDMYEEDIYNILRIGIGKDGFSTTEMSTKRMPNDLLEIYYDYLKEHGITQEFLSFLRNNFLPSYLHYCFVEQFLKPMKNLTK